MKDLVLKNGLAVYVDPKHIGDAAVYVAINSGSWQNAIPGLAHITEHIVGSAAKVYGERGALNYANSNAETGCIRTIYHFENMLPQHVTLAVGNLSKVFSPPDVSVLEREKNAVRHELQPGFLSLVLFSQKIERELFPFYCGKMMPTIQEELESLERITQEDILRFWNENYTTHNAFACLVGELPEFLDDVLQAFEQIPARDAVPEKQKLEPEQELTARIELKKQLRGIGLAYIEIDYQAPSFPHTCTLREEKAIELLAAYLCADHGPLYRRMRDEKGFCYSLCVQYNSKTPFMSNLYFCTRTQPELCERVEQEWKTVLEQIANKGITTDVLEAFKNKAYITALHRSRECDVGNIILKIDYGITHENIKKEIRNLTVQDIAKAAQTFAEKFYVVGIVLPK